MASRIPLSRRVLSRKHHVSALLSGCLVFILIGCGATTSVVRDFSFSAGPSSISVAADGGVQQISVSAQGIGGFISPVQVVVSGLPAGVTAQPAAFTLAAGAAQTVTITATSSAVAGNAGVSFTGTSGALTHSSAVALTVTPAPQDFSIVANPSSINVTAGVAGSSTAVSVAGINGFSSGVSFGVSGVPPGVSVSPQSFTLAARGTQTVTFTGSATAPASSATVTLIGTSGSLSHTATLTFNVVAAPPADFSIATDPAALSLTTGATGQLATISASAQNGFSGNITLSLGNLPPGLSANPSTLSLTPGTLHSVMYTAAANAAVGAFNIVITGQSGLLSHSAQLAVTVGPPTGNDAVTYHYDNSRTGWNPKETVLTPANVTSAMFGKRMSLGVDGKVDAEPLYVSAVTIQGQTHNVLYVVTEHDSIFAFDADNGLQLWKSSALSASETTSDDHGCGQITPEIGITSTPVIDRRSGTNGAIFLVAMSKDASGAYHQRLHGLDITTGVEIAGSPTEIIGSYPGTGDNSSNGTVVFAPGQYAERAGLLLLNQTIYLAWTSHCDFRPYTGWVMSYSESSLQQTHVLNLTPNGSEGSVWMSGAGLAADLSGNIFFLDANGTLDPSLTAAGLPANADYGNAIMKLSTTNNTLQVADYFEPYNSIYESNADIDLGSGGALLLPDLTDGTGKVRHLVVGAGKDTNIYVGDRDNLGKYNPANNSNLYQELTNVLPNGAWSMPAYFNGTLYYGGVGDHLKAFSISNAKLSSAPTSESSGWFAYPGATPSVSSNGTNSGIVWALESATGAAAVLHAYDAMDLSKELYNSTQAPGNRDSFGTGNKFITPLIINGKVYVGTPSGVAVFGLL
jgi:hypothetical protein